MSNQKEQALTSPVVLVNDAQYKEVKSSFLAALEAIKPEQREITLAGAISRDLASGKPTEVNSLLKVAFATGMGGSMLNVIKRVGLHKVWNVSADGKTFVGKAKAKPRKERMASVERQGMVGAAWMFALRAGLDAETERTISKKKKGGKDAPSTLQRAAAQARRAGQSMEEFIAACSAAYVAAVDAENKKNAA